MSTVVNGKMVPHVLSSIAQRRTIVGQRENEKSSRFRRIGVNEAYIPHLLYNFVRRNVGRCQATGTQACSIGFTIAIGLSWIDASANGARSSPWEVQLTSYFQSPS